jgi:hypothetical protein
VRGLISIKDRSPNRTDNVKSERQHIMTTTSPDASKENNRTRSPQAPKGMDSKRQGRRKTAIVSWYGSLLIFSMLLVAAGWEIFRWILAIITLD